MRRLITVVLAAILVVCTGLSAPAHSKAGRAQARTGAATLVAASSTPKRVTAYNYAKKQKGDPYKYGGNGPNSWDCSGLTSKSYGVAGISIGRTVAAQRNSSKTVHVSRYKAHYGDLVFWGTTHVELLAKIYKKNGKWYTVTFGAHHSGTRVGYRTTSGVPHIEHVNGAG